MDGFGLTWDVIHELNPQTIYVRMPAFGLTGPWRDNTGFAQTMEQMTGLAWLTGHAQDQPRIQRGPCDPLAGMHAAFAFLVALEERAARGEGVHVECTMVEGALNAAAEQLLEFTAYGNRMQREGNRGPAAAPQGLYACTPSADGAPQWLALAVANDAQWSALVALVADPALGGDDSYATHTGRRAGHDSIDARLVPWFAERAREELVRELLDRGIPAAPVADPRQAAGDPQLVARGFYEQFTHPVVGTHRVPVVPFRYASVEAWLRGPAPTLGQHNREVFRSLAGASEAELDELEAEGILGTEPAGL
jgi:crotonobetainyl-CoA:carnitine CoA-transferase CaiB-like acyl-CoA transferase